MFVAEQRVFHIVMEGKMKDKQKNNTYKIVAGIAIIVCIIVGILLALSGNQNKKSEKELAYDELLVQIKENKIEATPVYRYDRRVKYLGPSPYGKEEKYYHPQMCLSSFFKETSLFDLP